MFHDIVSEMMEIKFNAIIMEKPDQFVQYHDHFGASVLCFFFFFGFSGFFWILLYILLFQRFGVVQSKEGMKRKESFWHEGIKFRI